MVVEDNWGKFLLGGISRFAGGHTELSRQMVSKGIISPCHRSKIIRLWQVSTAQRYQASALLSMSLNAAIGQTNDEFDHQRMNTARPEVRISSDYESHSIRGSILKDVTWLS